MRGDATMKITDVKLRLISGTMPVEGEFWEERLIRPIDIYPEHKADLDWMPRTGTTNEYKHEAVFLEIHTDAGITGLGGPMSRDIAYIVDHDFRRLLLGADPLAGERLWDKMYRQ